MGARRGTMWREVKAPSRTSSLSGMTVGDPGEGCMSLEKPFQPVEECTVTATLGMETVIGHVEETSLRVRTIETLF